MKIPALAFALLAVAMLAASEPELRKKAQAGDAAAQLEYFQLVAADDTSDQETLEEAQGYLRRAAERGHADAQYHLGKYLGGGREVRGEFIEPDYDAAVHWYRKAAEQKHVGAMHEWGLVLAAGSVVPRDWAGALRWMREAALAGNAEAQLYLSDLHRTGEDPSGNKVPVDLAEAAKWRRMLVKAGDDTMYASYGEILARLPHPDPADLAEALKVLEAQVAGGNEYSQPALEAVRAKLGGTPGASAALASGVKPPGAAADGPSTLAQDQAGAAAGDAESMNRLAERFETGDGVGMDYDVAYDWFRRAAALGHAGAKIAMDDIAPTIPRAMYRLAARYEKGDGVPQDLAAALAWYEKAAAAGYEDADDAATELSIRLQRQEDEKLAGQMGAMKKQVDAGAAATPGQLKEMSTEELLAAYEKAGGSIGVAEDEDRATTVEEDTLGNSRNNPESAFRLGRRYETGDGVEKDTEMAFFFYRRAEGLGHPRAAEAIRQLTLAIGLARAASNLAQPASPGLSADAAMAQAQELMAKGRPAEAARMIQRAADMAETAKPASQYFLAGVLLNGQYGVPKDPSRATTILILSAQAGYGPAQVDYAKLLIGGGNGVAPDRAKAETMFRQAVNGAEEKSPEEKMAAAMLLVRDNLPGVAMDRARAYRLVESAADAGLPVAQIEFGRALYAGLPEVPQDQARAVAYLKKAEKFPQARYLIGLAHEQGIAGKSDLAEALKWYTTVGNFSDAPAKVAALRDKLRVGK